MPPAHSTESFLAFVEQSNLLPASRLAPYRADSAPEPPDRLAARMVGDRILTSFQAKMLLKGKHRGFFLTDKFKVLEHLGSGGMGQVFLCEHLVLQRLVAVKVLAVHGKNAPPPGAIERFYREARAVAALDHPNIVRVFDVDQVRGVPFMVMEYVDGIDLHRLTDACGPFPVDHAAEAVAQAAAGLQHAHEAGLVHRDIKPGNILLDRGGGVKLLDMGLARFLVDVRRNEGVTERYDENSVLGTADFIAPEQAIGEVVDIRADIYGLGCTLYYILTGQHVFQTGSLMQKLLWHQLREPDPVTTHRTDIPKQLSAVVSRMMAKKPADRYQMPAEVVAALSAWRAGRPVPPRTDALPRTTVGEYTLGLTSDSGPVSATVSVTPTLGNPSALTLPRTPSTVVRPATVRAGSAAASRPPARQPLVAVPEGPDEPDSDELDVTDPPARTNRKKGILLLAGIVALLGAVAGGVYVNLPPPVPVAKGTFGTAAKADAPAAGGAGTAADTATVFTGSGSAFVDPLMQHWVGVYRSKSGAWVVYDGVGSGKGVQNVLDGTSAFAASDAPLSDSQLAHAKSVNREVIHVPLVMGAVVPTYNVPDVPAGLRFTGPLLADIFLGKVKTWNDPAILRENPGVPIPATPIAVVYLAEPGGATYLWTEYLGKISPEWKANVGAGTSVKWPVGQPAKGNDGVAATVGQTPGGIGYVELSFALAKKLSYGAVKNRTGRFITPSLKSVTAAAAALPTVPDDLRYSLTDAPGDDSYPISGTTWAVIPYPVGGKPKSQVVKFVEWVTHEGQSSAAKLNYAPLPSSLVLRIDAMFSRLTP